MGRGRKPKPQAGRDGPGALPDMPDFVCTEVGRRFWDTYAAPLNKLGLLEFLDATAFAILCESFATLDDMRGSFSGEYTHIVGTNGALQTNPLVTEIRNQTKAVLALLEHFGLTPVGRQKLTGSTSATPADPNADPMAALANEVMNGGQIPDQPDTP